MGALRAAAFAITYVRIDSVRPGALALLLAVDGFAALSLVPSVKYLPALGREDIISQRTGLYLLMVGLSAVLVIGAVTLGAASPDGWGSWCYGPPSRWFSRGSRTGCSMPRPYRHLRLQAGTGRCGDMPAPMTASHPRLSPLPASAAARWASPG